MVRVWDEHRKLVRTLLGFGKDIRNWVEGFGEQVLSILVGNEGN